MKRLGTRLFYCLLTGNVLDIIRDQEGRLVEYTFEQECARLNSLNKLDINTIGMLEFEYGEYCKISKDSTGVIVDLETKQPIFSYEPLPELPQPPSKIEELENKISILEEENELLKLELSITQDAVNELLFNTLNV